MKTYNLALLGFGNVNRALVRLLEAKKPELRNRYGIEWRIAGVATRKTEYNPGLETAACGMPADFINIAKDPDL